MLADPLLINIDGTATSLPRVGSGLNSGTFAHSDGNKKLLVSHAQNRRVRRVIRFDRNKIAADVFQGGVNSKYSMSAYVVVDTPVLGFTTTEQVQNLQSVWSVLAGPTSDWAVALRILGGEA